MFNLVTGTACDVNGVTYDFLRYLMQLFSCTGYTESNKMRK